MKVFMIVAFCALKALAQGGAISAEIDLFPAGDFTAKSESVSGYVVEKDGKYLLGRPIVVKTSSFKTGIDLRDEHMSDYMSSKGKHKEIIINKGMGKGGKGVALLTMNGKSKKVNFDYEDEGRSIEAKFKIKISDFGIDGVNYKGIGVEDEVSIVAVIPKK